MRAKLRSLIERMLVSAGPTFKRFWVSIGFTVALTTTLIMSTTGPYPRPTEILNRLSLAFLAGILTSWCAVLFWESRGQSHKKPESEKKGSSEQLSLKSGQDRSEPLQIGQESNEKPTTNMLSNEEPGKPWLSKQPPANSCPTASALTGNLIALAAAGVVTLATYSMLKGLTFVPVSRHVGLCVFLFLLFFIIPHIKKNEGLEMYVVRLFTQAVVSVLFAAVMFIGLAAITVTVSSLFSLNLSYRIYIQIWLVMVGILAPFLFMAGIPAAGVTIETHDYPKILNNLIVYVVTPLLAAYTFILYLYFGKILITRQWPVGLVSHLVLWYSVASTAILYFVWPLTSDNKWAEAFSRYFKKAVIPLLAMMFFSIGIRIKFYGITENRYYVLALGMWVLGSMIYLNLAREKRSVILPISLAVVVALSVIGPWSSFAVSKWSQNRRLERLCAQHGMISDGSIIPSSQVTQADQKEIVAILQYFARYHDLSDVRLLPQGFALAQFEQVFGFSYADADFPRPVKTMHYDASNLAMDISEYQHLFDYTKPQYTDSSTTLPLSQGDVLTTYDWDTKRITVSLNGNLEWEDSFAEFISNVLSKYGPENEVEFRSEDMAFEAESSNLRIKVMITGLWGEVDPASQKPIVHQVGFFLLVGKTGK
ncbi:MAG: DUF4153 domain-containing protein [Bacillota bacterium]|jgi:hypothetical protein